MLHLHLSNRFEALLAQLTVELAQPGDVFTPTSVIVPSAAVQRAVTLHLADHLGVCSQVAYSYPAAWLWRHIGRAVPGVGAASPFDRQLLVWRVYRFLADEDMVARHPRLSHYVERCDDVMRYELAARTAGLLEQYVTYRPEWLEAWSRGEQALGASRPTARDDELWQAELWRRIASELTLTSEHPGTATVRALEAGADIELPAAVHVVGLSSLPPLYARLLHQFSRWMDVHVYALNPCQAYWFDVVDQRRLTWLALNGQDALHETGHRLLADWGRQTQAFLKILLDTNVDTEVDDAAFLPAHGGTLLASLQNAILDLEEPAAGSLRPHAHDRSVEVHVCHSTTRELEVLQDRLLALFAEEHPPQPSDILVVMPNLPDAAPLIEAVFGTAPAQRAIPFTITGLADCEENVYARVLLDLLGLVRGRATATELLALLQHAPVARRFDLDAVALEDVTAWVREAGMCWALDGEHRARFDVPASERHTLADGVQRLFLGYALPDAVAAPFDGRLPAGAPEGSSARALGGVDAVLECLRTLARAAQRDRPGPQWCALLRETLDELVSATPDDLPKLQSVRGTLHALQERMAQTGDGATVSLPVVQAALAEQLEVASRGGVPSGAVTFAPLAALRGLPYRIVCVLGLNDGVVPATGGDCEFDLMLAAPRAGDRQRRDDERTVFLDLVLATRERLHLSYVGRNARDNAAMPPSILVSELLDTLVSTLAMSPEEARRRLVIEHPLQPFASAAFSPDGDPRLQSFDAEYAQALRRALGAPTVPPACTPADGDDADESDVDGEDDTTADPAARAPLFSAPLAEPTEEAKDVPLDHLLQFFRNPSRFLLRQRLGVDLPRAEDALEDDEPLLADFPQRDALAARLLPLALAGRPSEHLRALALAGIEYPPGRLGKRQLEDELATLEAFADRVRDATAAATLAPSTLAAEVELEGRRIRVHGSYGDLREAGLVRYRYDDTRPLDYLAGWLHHVLLCSAAPRGVQPHTCWHSRNGHYQLRPVEDPSEVLRTLLSLYRRGLCAPLHFFPKSAWAYMVGGMQMSKAMGRWQVTPRTPHGEAADPAYALALRGVADPLDNEFTACADAVFSPLFACLDDPRLFSS